MPSTTAPNVRRAQVLFDCAEDTSQQRRMLLFLFELFLLDLVSFRLLSDCLPLDVRFTRARFGKVESSSRLFRQVLEHTGEPSTSQSADTAAANKFPERITRAENALGDSLLN